MTSLQQFQGGIIVSVQADEGEPLYPSDIITRLCQSVVSGGANALRLANPENVKAVKTALPHIPVIAITKPKHIPPNAKELVYITPVFDDIAQLHAAGADIVALDATMRPRPNGETLAGIVGQARTDCPGLLLMADIATLEEGLNAQALGFDLISTTLSGYTTETAHLNHEGPDFDLLEQLVQQVKTPVILEGRVWEPRHVAEAFARGAYAVVIGSAITRPHLITQRFCQASPQHVGRH